MKRRERQRQKLLRKYSKKRPHPFYQIDVLMRMPPPEDKVATVRGDEDGDVVGAPQVTYELMSGAADVRVLINPRVTVQDVRRGLAKIRKLLKLHGFDDAVEQLERAKIQLEVEACQHCGERLDRPVRQSVIDVFAEDELAIPF